MHNLHANEDRRIGPNQCAGPGATTPPCEPWPQRPAKLFYSVNEACELLGIGRSLLYELLAGGQVPYVYLGRRRLIPAEAVERCYSVEEACAALGVGRSFLYELVLSGDLPSRALGRRRLIPAAALEGWVVKRRAAGGEVDGPGQEGDGQAA